MQLPEQSVPVAASSPAIPTQRGRSLWFLWLALALSAVAAAVELSFVKPMVTQPPAPHTVEADTTAQLVGTTLDGEARGVLVRAEALATTPMLRAAISTDAKTLTDMAADKDVVFPHDANDTIEVLQSTATGRASMLRIPADAPPSTAPPPGVARVEQRGDRLVAIADAPITSSTTNAVAGEVVLTALIDLAPMRARPFTQLTGVTLTGFKTPVLIGGGAAPAAGEPVTAKVITTVAKAPALEVSGVVALPPTITKPQEFVFPAQLGCGVFAFLMLIGFGISLRRR